MVETSRKPEPTKRVGIWIRVSTEDQAKGESPEHHEQRARYYAEAKGWTVIDVYHLEGVSGKAVSEHPESQRMLKDIKRGHITGLIFSKLARLARNTRELLDFSEFFQIHGADLISLQESIDTSTPAGRLFYTMIAAMAQWEREEIAERVAASVPVRARMGKPLGGQASFGYQWKDGHLIPHPTEAPVRKLMYELFLEHRRKRTVACILNERGYRTSGGKEFGYSTVARLLRDPTAKGVRRANYTKSLGDGKKWELKPESDWVLTEVEPIVPEELWNECNRILDEQEARRKPPARKAVQLFGGLTVCHCGTKMYVPSNSPKYICQKCRNKIPVEDLEGVYYEQLKGFFLSPEEVEAFIGQGDDAIHEKEELVAILQSEQGKVQQKLDGIYDLYLNGEIPVEGFGKRTQPLQDRLDQLENEIPELQAEVDFLKINLLSADEILHEAEDLYSRWPKLDPAEKRQIVESITEQIVIGQDDVTIDLYYLPVSKELVTTEHRNFTVAVPFCHLTLSASKPKPSNYPAEPVTIGDRVRKRRLDLGLLQREVADIIGVTEETVQNWEIGNNSVALASWPTVLGFLGYDPRPPGQTIGEKLRRHREALGLSAAELARQWGVDPATVTTYELKEDSRHNHLSLPNIIRFLGYNPLPSLESVGQYIRQVRYLAGLKQTEFATRLQVSNHTVSEWELDRRMPSSTQLDQIEDIAMNLGDPFQMPCPERLRGKFAAATRSKYRRSP